MRRRLHPVAPGTDVRPMFSIKGIVQGVLLSFGVTLLGAVLMSLASMLLDWEKNASITMQWVNYISIGLGGIHAARRGLRLGWLHGGLVGLIYFLLLSYSLMDSLSPAIASNAWLMRLGIAFLVGALGGVLGVNV